MDNITVFSVFEVTRHLRQVIESTIEPLYVAGEVSNFTHHSSGHMYFNLKDENATMRCTFFKGSNYRLDFKPSEGMQVVCFGKITVFEKGGTYNLNVQSMSKAGLGLMQQKYEALKKKLQQEGLFESIHKQVIPKYPDKIGIVTSPTGAALQDIQNIILRRFPVELQVYPALVQGSEAPAQIVAGIRYFNAVKDVDLIIVTRGGGSQEDLFCFNDEALVRAVFASKIPIISAVGHEIDFTLCDFVADLRAPTPSAAAELAVPDKKDLQNLIGSLKRRLELSANKELEAYKAPLLEIRLKLAQYHPEKLWQSYQQRFDMATMGLHNSLKLIPLKRMQFDARSAALLSAISNKINIKLMSARANRDTLSNRLQELVNNRIQINSARLSEAGSSLQQLSPKRIQSKGWVMALKDGRVVSSVTQLKPQDRIELGFIDGSVLSVVESTREKP